MKLIILGAGGFGKTIADIAKQSEKYDEIYFLDDTQKQSEWILGNCCEFLTFTDHNTEMYPAFGNNEIRLAWVERLKSQNISLPKLIHSTAYVSPTAVIEEGTVVLPLAIVNADSYIKSGCIIDSGAIVDHGCVVEEGGHVSPGAVIKTQNKIPRGIKIEAGEIVPMGTYPIK